MPVKRSRSAPKQKRARSGVSNGKSSGVRIKVSRNAPGAGASTKIGRQPRQQTLKNGDVKITFREYISEINTTGDAFELQYFTPINPGSPTFGPWLARQATSYETYRFERLSFEFVPHLSMVTNGRVYMSADYDPVDPAPTSVVEMSRTVGATSGPIIKPLRFSPRPQDLHNRPKYFVRSLVSGDTNQAYGAADLRSLDVGNFYIGTQHCTNSYTDSPITGAIGQLWVSYTVVLMQPQFVVAPENLSALYTRDIKPSTNAVVKASIGLGQKKHFDSNCCSVPTSGVGTQFMVDGEGLLIVSANADRSTSSPITVQAGAAELSPNGNIDSVELMQVAGHVLKYNEELGLDVAEWAAETLYYIKAGARAVVNTLGWVQTLATTGAGVLAVGAEFFNVDPALLKFILKLANSLGQANCEIIKSGAVDTDHLFGDVSPTNTISRPAEKTGVQYVGSGIDFKPGSYKVTICFRGTGLGTGPTYDFTPSVNERTDKENVVCATSTLMIAHLEFHTDSETILRFYDLLEPGYTVTDCWATVSHGFAHNQVSQY